MSSKISCSPPPPPPSSSDIIGGNEDLSVEILLFLPAKTLVRFKLVSKGWLSLISSPSFHRRHTLHHPRRRHQTQPLFILGVGGHSSNYLACNPTTHKLSPFSFRLGFPLFEILQSCNGLLLIRCRQGDHGYSRHYVFNPTTMQHRELSPLPLGTPFTGLYLIFDPSLSPHYRVVCFARTGEGAVIHLYDPETHKWRLVSELDEVNMSFCNGIYFDRGISFVSFRSSPHFVSNVTNTLYIRPHYKMESNGVLHAFVFGKDGCKLVYVFEMSENRWSSKYRVDFTRVLGEGNCVESIILLGMFSGGEREEDSLLVFHWNRKVMIYKFYDDVFEVVVDYGSMEENKLGCFFVKDAHHFIHTLAPL